jgi:hypothetical protein
MDAAAAPQLKSRPGAALARVIVGLVLAYFAADHLRFYFGVPPYSSAGEPAVKTAFGFAGLGCAFVALLQLRAAARAWRGAEEPNSAWAGRTFGALFCVWAVWYFLMCMPYFMRPYTMGKERRAAVAAKVPEAARLDELDAAGVRALTVKLLPLLSDADTPTRVGAREVVARVASRPDAPKDLLIPALIPELENEKFVHASSAWALGQLGEEGKAALLAAVAGPGDYAPQAAAMALSQLKPPPPGTADAIEKALLGARTKDARSDLQYSLDRVQGKRR